MVTKVFVLFASFHLLSKIFAILLNSVGYSIHAQDIILKLFRCVLRKKSISIFFCCCWAACWQQENRAAKPQSNRFNSYTLLCDFLFNLSWELIRTSYLLGLWNFNYAKAKTNEKVVKVNGFRLPLLFYSFMYCVTFWDLPPRTHYGHLISMNIKERPTFRLESSWPFQCVDSPPHPSKKKNWPNDRPLHIILGKSVNWWAASEKWWSKHYNYYFPHCTHHSSFEWHLFHHHFSIPMFAAADRCRCVLLVSCRIFVLYSDTTSECTNVLR